MKKPTPIDEEIKLRPKKIYSQWNWCQR